MNLHDTVIDLRLLIRDLISDIVTERWELSENEKEDLRRSINHLQEVLN